jgi:hypothetical protein
MLAEIHCESIIFLELLHYGGKLDKELKWVFQQPQYYQQFANAKQENRSYLAYLQWNITSNNKPIKCVNGYHKPTDYLVKHDVYTPS